MKAIQANFNCESKVSVLNFSCVCSVVQLLLTRCHHQHQKRIFLVNRWRSLMASTTNAYIRFHAILKMKSNGKCKAWTKLEILFVWLSTQRNEFLWLSYLKPVYFVSDWLFCVDEHILHPRNVDFVSWRWVVWKVFDILICVRSSFDSNEFHKSLECH